MRRSAFVAALLLPISLLAGCGFRSTLTTSATHITGKVFGGQNPISSATVTVWQVGAIDYDMPGSAVQLAQTTSVSDGTFDIPAGAYICPTPTTQVYITAAGGYAIPGHNNSSIMLVAGLGNCSALDTQSVNINEVTTAVTAFALAPFFVDPVGNTIRDDFGAPLADMNALAMSNTHTIPTLVDLAHGTVNPNTASITIESAKIYTIANVLASCVNSTSASTACTTLFADTTDPYNDTVPVDTLQAAAEMAYYPYQNVAALYMLSVPQAPFVGLASAPNDWTIGVSYKTSTMGLGITGTAASATSSTIDIDAAGRIWVPSNAPGKTGVGYFDPATNTFTGPLNATGVTLVQPQYVAIDPSGFAWVTDSSSSNMIVVDTANLLPPSSRRISGATALGPVSIDATGDAFFSFTDSSGDANLGEVIPAAPGFTSIGAYTHTPTGLSWTQLLAGDQLVTGVYAAASGSSTPCTDEYLFRTDDGPYTGYVPVTTSSNCTSGGEATTIYAIDGLAAFPSLNQVCSAYYAFCVDSTTVPLSAPQGVATDGYSEEWVANAGSAAISTFDGVFATPDPYQQTSPLAYLHDATHGNTMTKPYGIAIDGSGNVWVANAGCVTTSGSPCTPTSLVLSEVIGVAGPTITPLSAQLGGNLTGTEPEDETPAARAQPKSLLRRRFASRRSTSSSSIVRPPWLAEVRH